MASEPKQKFLEIKRKINTIEKIYNKRLVNVFKKNANKRGKLEFSKEELQLFVNAMLDFSERRVFTERTRPNVRKALEAMRRMKNVADLVSPLTFRLNNNSQELVNDFVARSLTRVVEMDEYVREEMLSSINELKPMPFYIRQEDDEELYDNEESEEEEDEENEEDDDEEEEEEESDDNIEEEDDEQENNETNRIVLRIKIDKENKSYTVSECIKVIQIDDGVREILEEAREVIQVLGREVEEVQVDDE